MAGSSATVPFWPNPLRLSIRGATSVPAPSSTLRSSRAQARDRLVSSINTGGGAAEVFDSGVATDTCVEATARDAYFVDYYVMLVQDCCGALDEEDHRVAAKRFARDYGPVVTSSEVIAVWQRTPAQTHAATAELLGP